jgi:ketosteroid isomerase-like protein
MSQGNLEIAKRGIDAFNRRDVEALADVVTRDFEWFPALPSTVEGERFSGYRGREGIETYFEDVRVTWEGLRVLGNEFRDLGDSVVLLGRADGRGRGSGVEVDMPLGVIYDFRDGRISRVRTYLDHGEALRAAGLAE